MTILVTGAAGFIGRAVCEKLLNSNNKVIGLDNLNDYYSVQLKKDRLKTLQQKENFIFYKQDIIDDKALFSLFEKEDIDYVIHLAAQPGVRYSIKNPQVYAKSNLLGFTNILEACRHYSIKHLLYASSSSVYGKNTKVPFHEDDRTDNPASFYAATKKANELMAISYSDLYKLPISGLRFFTVYGPWGRPDMAPWIFTDAIFKQKEISIFNNGKLQRDFTYIDDIVEGVIKLLLHIPEGELPHDLYNIGNHQPVELMTFIDCVEESCNKKAIKKYLPMQDGDVFITYADTERLRKVIDFYPNTTLKTGIKEFVNWYREYHAI